MLFNNSDHDEFIQFGIIFEFSITVEQQSCMIFSRQLSLMQRLKIGRQIMNPRCIKKLKQNVLKLLQNIITDYFQSQVTVKSQI